MVTPVDKVLYTAHVHTTGGRDGRAVSDDGLLDVKLNPPKTLGGQASATNPEQLFAAGYSACFIGALKYHAGQRKIGLPGDLAVDTSVDIGPAGVGFGLAVRMKVSLPGMDPAVAQQLLDAANETCPYSRATRGNIPVDISLA